MKKNLKEQFRQRKINKPNALLAAVAMPVLGHLAKKSNVSYTYDYDKKQYASQSCILLATHSARLEFVHVLHGFGKKDINIVVGYQNIMKKYLYTPLKMAGIISKYLYQPDISCTKSMLSVLKRKGSLLLFPEGIQSTSGSAHPINPATTKLLKRGNVPVFLCKSQGSYLSTNRYSSDVKKGAIKVHYQLLFTAEELKTLSEEQIYQKLLEAFRYNDFEANKQNKVQFVGKRPNIDGLNNIIYKCPHCNKEFCLEVRGENMVCTECGYEVTMDNYYCLHAVNKQLLHDDVDKWYKWQRKVLHQEVTKDGFQMQMQGQLCTLRTDKLCKSPKNRILQGEGTFCLTRNGLMLDKTNGERIVFDAKNLYSLTFTQSGLLEFYYNEEYYIIVPLVPRTMLAKWTIASEEIHNLHDERWAKASQDVYDY